MKVWRNKGNNQLLVTIPKDSNIKEGDNVKIEVVKWQKKFMFANIAKRNINYILNG